MPERIQHQPQPERRETDTVREEGQSAEMPTIQPENDLAAIDKLLDEIDGVLEENAQAFVDSYQQRGGQ